VIIGNSLANTIDGKTGVDMMAGGLGDDIYFVENAGDIVVENDGEGVDTVKSIIDYSLGENVENLTLTGTADIDGYGNSLDNILTGNSGKNRLTGGIGNDIYVVDNAGDVVTENAGEGIDTVQSSISYALGFNLENLTLTSATGLVGDGNALNNVITSGAGNDTLSGGDGNDIYVVNNTGDVVTESLDQGTDTVQASVSYSLNANVENLTLTGSADINATGNSLDNIITGNNSNNVLDGGLGADTLTGGAGNDMYVVDNTCDVVTENMGEGTDTVQSSISYTLGANAENLTLTGTANIDGTGNELDNVLTGNSGANNLIGGIGNDMYVVDNTGDVVTENAGEGTDTVQSGISYTLGANVENLTLTGTANIDGTGNELDNVLTGNSGANKLTGGAGNDVYVVNNTDDVVIENAGEGTDTVQSSISYTLGANMENLTLIGTATLNGMGNTLDNVITGTGKDNVLDGQAGADTMIGGAGNDTYVVDNAGDVVLENASEGSDTVQSSVSYTLGGNVENLTLTSSAGNIDGIGNTLNNVITGNSLSNVLDGQAGVDTMTGGAGDDTYIVDNSGDIVTEKTGEGIDAVWSSINYALGANLENLTLLGAGDINGDGNSLDNVIIGNKGDNNLYGYAGNDFLDGGEGADIMGGGTGNDVYVMDNVNDIVQENVGEGVDTVQSTVTYSLGVNVENLTQTGTANVDGYGNGLHNVIYGNSGNNILDGGAGNDTMVGGAGDDTYVVDSTGDVITENAGEGVDTVRTNLAYTLTSNVENLTLTGSTDINGTGNAQGNIITGNGGNNVLDGGAGTDTLLGGAGNDTYIVDNTGDMIIENAGEGIDTVRSSASYTLSDNVENLTLTGTADLAGAGNSLDNTITSGAGNDTLIGGIGNDTYVVNSISDVIVENAGAGIDTMQSSVTYTLSENMENLTLTGTGNLNGYGNSLDNVLTGNSGINVLTGYTGNDTYVIDNVSDAVMENANEGIDTVQSSVTYTLGGNVENLTLPVQLRSMAQEIH
jgi:trimeric autotransporter adhesin